MKWLIFFGVLVLLGFVLGLLSNMIALIVISVISVLAIFGLIMTEIDMADVALIFCALAIVNLAMWVTALC